MEFSYLQFFLLGALTFIFVGALTPIMRKIALRVGAVDVPNLARKAQKEPVPYLGGSCDCNRDCWCFLCFTFSSRLFN